MIDVPLVQPPDEIGCAEDGCEGRAVARGWCKLHYDRWWKANRDDMPPRPSVPLEDRFWAKVAIGAPDECWPWLAGMLRTGYGKFGDKKGGRTLASHRLAYELTHGAIPAGAHVLHHCDNRPCCNPAHLYAGTRADNARDMVERGRSTAGERHPMARLTTEAVKEIRRRYAVGDVRQHELGAEFGVSRPAISVAVSGKSWRSVGTEER